MGVTIPSYLYAALKQELATLPSRTRRGEHGESAREQVFRKFEAMGLRRQTFYKLLRSECGARRSDCGRPRKSAQFVRVVTEIFELQCQLSDFDKGCFMASEVALAHAERRGLIAAGELSVRNYNLWVQRLGLREARGIVRIQASHSNQVHQVDVTGSAYLAVVRDLGGGEYLLRRRSPRERLAKQPTEERLRLWSVAVKDDFSGVFVSQYAVAAGESALLVQDFLLRAWRGLDAAVPLRGLPELLYCDNGPFARAETTISFLSQTTGVGVDLKTHMPYRARATGKVEAVHRFQKSRFEMQFLGSRAEWLLSDMNGLLLQWAAETGKLRHRQLPMTRAEAYLTHLAGPVRLPHDEARRNAYRVVTRKSGTDGVISLNGVLYQVGNELRNRELLVQVNVAGEVRVTDPLTNATVTPEVWSGPRGYGEFESRVETEMDRTAKRRDRGEWGDLPHELAGKAAATVVPFMAAVESDARQTPFTQGKEFADALEAKKWLATELGIGLLVFKRDYPGLWAEFEELLGKTLNREEVAHWARRDGLRVAIGGGR